MIAIINSSQLEGSVMAPPSKSSMQRACAAALIAGGRSVILEPGISNDDIASIEIIQKLGAQVKLRNDAVEIFSEGIIPQEHEINCGESGLAIRMFVPIASLSGESITITGTGSLLDRPMGVFDEIFPRLGVDIQSDRGKLPLVIKGPLKPADIEVDGSLSSQFLTGLIMAFAAAKADGVRIRVLNLKSKAYIDLTLDVLKQFGLAVPINNNYEEIISKQDDRSIQGEVEYRVEKDWSGAAFLLVAGAIAGPLMVKGLDPSSTQPDKAMMDVLMDVNAGFALEAKGIKIHPAKMKAFDFDATDCPDLFPPLTALACYCRGESRIRGVSRLLHKESNRSHSLQQEFTRMGASIRIEGDYMMIKAENLFGAEVNSHHDHRIAMALAVAALKADGETRIKNVQSVDKSYPDFFKHLELLGASLTLKHE